MLQHSETHTPLSSYLLRLPQFLAEIFGGLRNMSYLCGVELITFYSMCQLQKQYDYFRRNMSSLLEDHKGMFLTISEDLEVKAFATIVEAYSFGAKTYGLGHFLLQECTEEADKIQIISNMAYSAV